MLRKVPSWTASMSINGPGAFAAQTILSFAGREQARNTRNSMDSQDFDVSATGM
jgi:hypothetical protein